MIKSKNPFKSTTIWAVLAGIVFVINAVYQVNLASSLADAQQIAKDGEAVLRAIQEKNMFAMLSGIGALVSLVGAAWGRFRTNIKEIKWSAPFVTVTLFVVSIGVTGALNASKWLIALQYQHTV